MAKERLKELLTQVHQEAANTELDDEARSLIAEFDRELHGLLGDQPPAETDAAERAKLLEVRFASQYPTLERFFREMVDALARMGV